MNLLFISDVFFIHSSKAVVKGTDFKFWEPKTDYSEFFFWIFTLVGNECFLTEVQGQLNEHHRLRDSLKIAWTNWGV